MSRCLHLVPDSTYLNWFQARAKQMQKGPQQYVRISMRVQPSQMLLPDAAQTIGLYSAAYHALQKAVSAGDYEKVIVHYLSPESARFLRGCHTQHTTVIWMFWGGDFYYLPRFWQRTYHDFSLSYKRQQALFYPSKYHWLRAILSLPSFADVVCCLHERIHYCATFLDTDFAEVQNAFPNSNIQWLNFHYQSLIDIDEKILNEENKIIGNYILLGNSADPANNHWEAMCHLGQRMFDNPIICPLSYGEHAYGAQIEAAGTKIWGEQFRPILGYMPRPDYHNLLKKVGYAVFNHRVQQAVGNVLPLLCNGVKVFLSRESTLYVWLKQRGLHLFTVEEDLGGANWQTPLNATEVLNNRLILSALFSDEKTDLAYQRLLT